eukprot:11795711-Ditylum_brightwellii.AAC.1
MSISKLGNEDNSQVCVGLGWTACDLVDLDVSAVCVGSRGQKLVVVVYYGALDAVNSIHHSCDNVTGVGSCDKEVITITFGQ